MPRPLARPYNGKAIYAANTAVQKQHPGLSYAQIRQDPKLNAVWEKAYSDAGGKFETAKPSGKSPSGTCAKCPVKKTVTAKIVSVTFRTDHLDAAGKKLIKRASPQNVQITKSSSAGKQTLNMVSDFGDSYTEFLKPEWAVARGGSADSHPVSHTKGLHVQVDVEIDFTVTPSGQTAALSEVSGVASENYLTFKKAEARTVGTQRITVTKLYSKGTLPKYVDLVADNIQWSVVVDGEKKEIGTSGEHVIYVTYDKPFGKMASSTPNTFEETGGDQAVTERRLQYSVFAAQGSGQKDEKECVDAIFEYLKQIGVGYALGFRWTPGAVNDTGVTPKPTAHHYLWLCNAHWASGECHNIAAAFALACRILGVTGPFEIGYMFPWPSRSEAHPMYPKRGDKIRGRYNKFYWRNHSVQSGHGNEKLVFLDGSGQANNFEGVAKYRNGLYAIGDDVFDKSALPDENASAYFARWTYPSLVFADAIKGWHCKKPYPWKTDEKFSWEE